MDRKLFYKKNVNNLIKDKKAEILIVAGGGLDKKVFHELGFKNVTITNLDSRKSEKQFVPYKWSFQDAENLTYQDNEFDYAVIHAGLHHCKSPHKALLEMYRVSKKGIFSVEAKDSLLMKLAIKLNLAPQYETAAVFFNDMKFGGLNNTEIPNFIYRWSENEIEKAINCYAPFSRHKIKYFYAFSLPEFNSKSPFKRIIFNFIKIILKLMPKNQGNLFAFFIEKPDLINDSFPWITYKKNKLTLNKKWLKNNWMKKQKLYKNFN